mgnify:FL=1|tara:strand:- start:678 stop:1463 length:786 start_codon:yes stop_codon:yes gene_type:complete
MPNKKKFGKKSKLKRKMKGGADAVFVNEDKSPMTEAQVARQAAPQARAVRGPSTDKGEVPIYQPSSKSRKGGSTYNKYADSIYINGITAFGVVGFVWMMISRSLIRHKYSEAVSYGLMELAVTFSLFLIFFKRVRNMNPTVGIVGMIKEIIDLTKYMLKRSTPGLLIIAQLAVLIWLMTTHADYLFENENMPRMFGIFNSMTIAMIMGQCWVWRGKVLEIMTGKEGYRSPLIVPGFILAALLSGVAISQMWVILEYLNVDC